MKQKVLPKISQKSYRNLIISLSGLLLVLLIILLYPAITESLNILKKYLGLSFPTIVIFLLTILILWWGLWSTRDFHKNFWFYFTLGLMASILFFGVYFIDQISGKPNFPELILRDLDNNLAIVGSLTCHGSTPNQFFSLGEEVNCFVNEPNLTSLGSKVTFYLNDNSNFSTEMIYGKIGFIAPPNVSYLSFYIEGRHANEELRHLSVGYPYHFLDEDEAREADQRFLAYLYALVGLVFISVPIAIKTLKDLYLNKEK